jgi:nitrilase
MAITSRLKTTKAKLGNQAVNKDIIKMAAIQMASGPHVSANLSEAERLIEIAVNQGAKLVVLPEYFAIMGLKDTDKIAVREEDGTGQIQDFLSKTAKKI